MPVPDGVSGKWWHGPISHVQGIVAPVIHSLLLCFAGTVLPFFPPMPLSGNEIKHQALVSGNEWKDETREASPDSSWALPLPFVVNHHHLSLVLARVST